MNGAPRRRQEECEIVIDSTVEDTKVPRQVSPEEGSGEGFNNRSDVRLDELEEVRRLHGEPRLLPNAHMRLEGKLGRRREKGEEGQCGLNEVLVRTREEKGKMRRRRRGIPPKVRVKGGDGWIALPSDQLIRYPRPI